MIRGPSVPGRNTSEAEPCTELSRGKFGRNLIGVWALGSFLAALMQNKGNFQIKLITKLQPLEPQLTLHTVSGSGRRFLKVLPT